MLSLDSRWSPVLESMRSIRLLVMDVDGVLTSGGITYTASGDELKTFDVKDGAGLAYWSRAGYAAAILTGRTSVIVERRAQELGIAHVHQGSAFKVPAFEQILSDAGVTARQAAYIGDDLPDIPVFRAAGLAVSVADATPEARESADVVTEASGGRGAVRELIRALLIAQGQWDMVVSRYFETPQETS